MWVTSTSVIPGESAITRRDRGDQIRDNAARYRRYDLLAIGAKGDDAEMIVLPLAFS